MHTIQENTTGGIRYSSSYAYLVARKNPTLEIQMHGTVSRVVIEDGRAIGVEVIDDKDQHRLIRAGREVVLSAGAFGSPQHLMPPGVARKGVLEGKGVSVSVVFGGTCITKKK